MVDSNPFIKLEKPSFKERIRQQQLPAWQPILLPETVLPIIFGTGVFCLSVGMAMLHYIQNAHHYEVDYTNCFKTEGNDTHWIDLNQTCVNEIKSNITDVCYCRIIFNVTTSLDNEVFIYYKLTNFYQSHRKYLRSVDRNQLLGKLYSEPSSKCAPFDYSNETGLLRPIAPCGAIANSMFNDKLELFCINKTWKKVPVLRTGIAWDFYRKSKFRNPPGDLKKAFENFSKPLRWKINIWELDLENEQNNGLQNEDFIVWMRPAVFPTFRKLYRRVDHDVEEYKAGLRNGSYMLKVEYNYDVSSFGGTKGMVLCTTSALGGKTTNVLGILYIIVGPALILTGFVLLYIHTKYGFDNSADIEPFPNYLSVE